MSHTLAAPGAGSAGHAPPAAYRRAGASLAAEWIKLRSLRSMLLTPLLGAVACIGLADAAVENNAAGWAHLDAVQKARFDPLSTNFNFEVIGILLFGVLGALVVTNEYGSGLIRTTLAAMPQRGLVLAAKAVLASLVAVALAVVIVFTAFFTGQGILSGYHAPHVSLGDHNVLAHLMGTVYYMTAAGLIGLFCGVLVRSAAAAITRRVRAPAGAARAGRQDHAGCRDAAYRAVSPLEPRRRDVAPPPGSQPGRRGGRARRLGPRPGGRRGILAARPRRLTRQASDRA